MSTEFDAWIELVGGALAGLEAAIQRVPHSAGCAIHAPRHECDCVGPHEPDCTAPVSRECTCPRAALILAFRKAQADVRAGAEAVPRSLAVTRLLVAVDAVYGAMSRQGAAGEAAGPLNEMHAARKVFGP
jgi:hypothetical protein